ncbi:hypothetical protein APHAL10511_001314 [Amanita phalloides]|nr:hypothetical protein APHAL10511_001314 [Amanita phalloides]
MALELLQVLAAIVTFFILTFTPSGRNVLREVKNCLLRPKDKNHEVEWPDYAQLTGVPLPNPLVDFKIDDARPRPYRPFRWEYHQTMSLIKMEPDWWLELESTYRERLIERRKLYEMHGTGVVDSLPGSESACRELAQMAIQFLCARYPNQFAFNKQTGVFYNRILDAECKVRETKPLLFLLEHVPEDFAIMLQKEETGLYHLCAAISCSSIGWLLQEKMGKPLHEIHEPVPYYKEKMELSMDRYFSKLQCDQPIQRGSWGFEIGQPLYLQSDHDEWRLRETQCPDLRLEDIHLRVDWQTLRRLPKSRAVVINFKALFTPVTSFRDEPYIPRLMLTILREAKQPLLKCGQ